MRARRPGACRRPQPRAKASANRRPGRTPLDRPERGRANPSPTGTSVRACAPFERTTGRRRPPPRNPAARYRRPAGGAMVVLNQQPAPRRARRDDLIACRGSRPSSGIARRPASTPIPDFLAPAPRWRYSLATRRDPGATASRRPRPTRAPPPARGGARWSRAMMPSAKPSTAPSAIVAPTLTRASSGAARSGARSRICCRRPLISSWTRARSVQSDNSSTENVVW